jgi:O-antigen ligase
MLFALVLSLALLADYFIAGNGPGWLWRAFAELWSLCRDCQTQWMLLTICAIYLVGLSALGARRANLPFWRWRNPDVWLLAAVFTASAVYLFRYGEGRVVATPLLTFLGGAVIGKLLSKLTPQRLMVLALASISAALAAASFLNRTPMAEFAYHGEPRWIGPWDNPNRSGVLMSVAVVCAVGLATLPRQSGVLRTPSAGSILRRVVWWLLAAWCGWHLLQSYSRGAWVAAICGLTWIAYESARLWRPEFPGPIRLKLFFLRTANRFAITAMLLGVSVMMFWSSRDVKLPLVRRAFSIANVNSFSWRNRVTAWEGSFEMMAERPWFGFGWRVPAQFYDQFFRDSKLAEFPSVHANDYLMLGMTLGIPALACFLACVTLSLSTTPRVQSPMSQNLSPAAICRAGAIVSLVGLWFEGADAGLFSLSTGSVFWTLLALGTEHHQFKSESA